jgi:hypothetical protein
VLSPQRGCLAAAAPQPSLKEDAAGAPACLPLQVARAVEVDPTRARHGPAARTDVQGQGGGTVATCCHGGGRACVGQSVASAASGRASDSEPCSSRFLL